MTESTMAQGIEASLEAGPGDAATRPSVSSRVARNWMWLGVGGVSLVAGGFLLHQLMAWPPHEDETLALFVGRDSLPGVVEHVTRERGGAPLHFLLAWGVAHLGFGLGGLRILSAVFALASLPLVAALGRRLGGPLVGLVAAAIVAPSWLFLFHGVYGRMYSLFLFLSLACTLALLRALERGGRGRWAVWVAASLCMVAAHPYGILLLAGQAAYVLLAARDRIREAIVAGVAVLVLGIPFWLTDLVLAGRFDVGVGGGGEKLGGPQAVARYLWRSVGDATAGWWPVTLAVLVAAAIGVVLLRRTPRTLVLCLVGTTVAAFLVAKLGGSAAPESRHLIFLAPLLAISVAVTIARVARRSAALGAVLVAGLVVAQVAWAWQRTPPLFEWEPDARQAARAEAEAWLASTSRPDDVLFGYEPLYLDAREKGAPFGSIIVQRADPRLAIDTLEEAPKPLGRGVWVFDATDQSDLERVKLTIPGTVPGPIFEGRAWGPFLVIRTKKPVGDAETFFKDTAAVELQGRTLGVGDASINLQTALTALSRLEAD
jgi:hypothetical protein